MFSSFKKLFTAKPAAESDDWFNNAVQPLLLELPGAKQPEAARQLNWLIKRHHAQQLSKACTLQTANNMLERMLREAPAESEAMRIVRQVLNRHRSLIVGSSPNQRALVADLIIGELNQESYSLETGIQEG